MRLFSHVTLFAFCVLFLAGCGEEGASPVAASSDPTPGQLGQALSDPAFVEAVEMLAGDGLGVDAAAGHVISDEAGNWALEAPVVRLYTGGVVPYEAVVYEVMAGVGEVHFVLAADGGAFEAAADGVEPVVSEEPRLGQSTHNAIACGPWTAWWEVRWQCLATTSCPNRGRFVFERRARWCNEHGTLVRRFQDRRRLIRCGC